MKKNAEEFKKENEKYEKKDYDYPQYESSGSSQNEEDPHLDEFDNRNGYGLGDYAEDDPNYSGGNWF